MLMDLFIDYTLCITIQSPQLVTQVYTKCLGLVPVSTGDVDLGSMPLLHPMDSGRDPTLESRGRKRTVVSLLGRKRESTMAMAMGEVLLAFGQVPRTRSGTDPGTPVCTL